MHYEQLNSNILDYVAQGQLYYSTDNYGLCTQPRGMRYALLRLYGLWYAFTCEPTRWTKKCMRYEGVWVI